MTDYNTFKTVELRKLAREMGITELPSGRKVNAGRKEELITAIENLRNETFAAGLEGLQGAGLKAEAELEAGQSIAANGAEKKRAAKCQICEIKKIDWKTQGRDSTMCAGCYDYAGWENTHSDDRHEKILNWSATTVSPSFEQLQMVKECPVCQKLQGEFEPEPTSQMLIGHAKAARLAAFAEEHNWSVAYATNEAEGGDRHVLEIFSPSGDVYFEIIWHGRVFQYDLSSFKNGKRPVKVRNVSAAKQIIAA